MWTRERRPNNMVINDPKGELLCKNYVRGTMRGFQIVQFNLINAMKTDIYNPLALAADAAREGDSTKCAMYVENIAEVFFPLDGGDDPVWPNAANNAFKRAAYGMIDYYLEEEKELRLIASQTGMDDKVLERKIDELWGKVTLYNCYQLFVQLSSKKKKSPAAEFTAKAKAGEFDTLSDDEYQIEMKKAEEQSKIWEDKPEADMLTLFFNATDKLPKNSMRTLVGNANNALKSMAGAEKMLASVYGIASGNTNRTISIPSQIVYNGNTYVVDELRPACFCNYYEDSSGKRYYVTDGKSEDGAPYNKYTKAGTGFDKQAYYNSRIREIILPNTITSIGDYAFSNRNLTTIKLNEGVKIIGESAFSITSKITSIIIPSTVETMGYYCFSGCSLLRKIIYLSSSAPQHWTATSFTDITGRSYINWPSELRSIRPTILNPLALFIMASVFFPMPYIIILLSL